MRGWVLSSALLLAATTPANASAADLNRPVRPRPPTVASEALRGRDAAGDCFSQFFPGEPELFRGCLHEAEKANRQQLRTGYQAFDAGLYYEVKARLDPYIKSKEFPGTYNIETRDQAAVALRSAEHAIGATDSDLARVLAK